VRSVLKDAVIEERTETVLYSTMVTTALSVKLEFPAITEALVLIGMESKFTPGTVALLT